jgi:bifunctional UDP-N-acetylglucosamine pyrophosphorylase/glucosamine-1-phosphate N-acetyltransferase
METELTVLILAAGLGTRMKSSKAKVLHRAGGKTLIEHVLDTALTLTAPERVFVVVGHQGDRVRETVGSRGVRFIEQREQKGTGHALMAGRDELSPLGGLLMVLSGDCPLISSATLGRLISTHRKSEAAATLITTIVEDPTGYGRVLQYGDRVRAIVEQKAATAEQLAIREINSGNYCFQATEFWAHIDEIRPDNPAREYYLTDMIGILNRAGGTVRALRIDDPGEALGINNKVELAKIDALFRARKVEELMLAGVTIERPETVTIDAGVTIGMDTLIEPFTRILGATTIGEQCAVGACSIIEDSALSHRVLVRPFTSIAGSEIGDDAQIGPYARLRPGSRIEPGAHVGNFVELKNTRLGAGSKANHLAYLGDSEIGRQVNIGAGTITCNYDGKKKHPTKIADGVFVGSNSTLVAPIDIGEGAYLAAGSVITHPVPADALALGRARQVNKDGWARKRKA